MNTPYLAILLLLAALAGTPLSAYASGEKPCCCCKTQTTTIVSGTTTEAVGFGNAVAITPAGAWTAVIASSTTWIWKAGATAPNETVAFEKSFTVVGTVLSATLDIAADNSYKVFIDGIPVAADPAATNFTVATQDFYDLTAQVTPGVHTLRIEVTNNGTFGELNPAGLLYKFRVVTCYSHPPEIDIHPGGITVVTRNIGTITTATLARSVTGGNVASGSVGGAGAAGGDVDTSTTLSAGNNNNGGAVAGVGGAGGTGGRGGRIVTGEAVSEAHTTNELNTTRVRISR